jgi:hypothetical protein
METKITIAKPCHENWNKMTPQEQGRHCAVCSKVVKDFTGKKTEDILNTLKNTEGEVCGRIGIQHLTPTNKRQKIFFWTQGIFYRKAIYPLLAFLGVGLILKKTHAQTGDDYQIKGKMAVKNQHTQTKKITLVVKSAYNEPIQGAVISFISGLKYTGAPIITDANGRVSLLVEATDIISSTVTMEISAPGYELKRMEMQLVKDMQTVEIKMNSEVMLLGEMGIYPVEEKPETVTKTNTKDIEIESCGLDTILQLDMTRKNDAWMIAPEPVFPVTEDEAGNKLTTDEALLLSPTEITATSMKFDLFPNPATSQVNVVASGVENFNVEIFDANGKKIHNIMNANQRYVLDVINYAPGVYYALILIEGMAVETKKMVVTR